MKIKIFIIYLISYLIGLIIFGVLILFFTPNSALFLGAISSLVAFVCCYYLLRSILSAGRLKEHLSIDSAVKNIRASEEQQAQGVLKTVETLGGVITSLHDLTNRAQDIFRGAQKVADAAKKTLNASQSGVAAIDIINSEMEKIKNQVAEIVRDVMVLEARSNQITKITEMIDEIVEQTNLLAVNASIEAAKAGEAGRGFQAVAGEIKKLSERATESTKDIKELIAEIQMDTTAANKATGLSKESIEQGIKNIKKSGEAIEEINQMIIQSSTAVQAILAASGEQKDSSSKIVAMIRELSNVSLEFEKSAESLVDQTSRLKDLEDK